MDRVDQPCEHMVKVLKDAEALGVTFTPYGQFTEVCIECGPCQAYIYARESMTSERVK